MAFRRGHTAAAMLAACGVALALSAAAPAVPLQDTQPDDELVQRELRQLHRSLDDLQAQQFDLQIQIAEADSPEEREQYGDELFRIEQEIATVEESILRRGGDPAGQVEDEGQDAPPPEEDQTEADRRAEALAALQAGPRGAAEGMVEIGPFSEPVDIMRLVEFVQQMLDLNLMVVDPGLEGQQVVIRTPISVPEDALLDFLVMLLEQKGYTLVPDRGVYLIVQSVNPPMVPSTTQIIPTRGLRPSQVSQLMAGIVAQAGRVQPLDEMGALLVTASPRQLGLINDLLDEIVASLEELEWKRFELEYVTAEVAHQRLLQLLDPSRTPVRATAAQPGQDRTAGVAIAASVVDLPQRLWVDTQSNALYFRGRDDETLALQDLLDVIDRPNTLVTRWYEVSTETATKLVSAGEREGLGSVVFEDVAQQQPALRGLRAPQFQGQTETQGGPAFVIYPDASGFMYYGTETQHQRVEQLMYQFEGIESGDTIVYEFYKLAHSDAVEVAALIQDLISAQVQAGNRGLVGEDLSRRGQEPPPVNQEAPEIEPAPGVSPGDEAAQIGAILPTEDINVLADEFNNQIIVKAPSRLQPQFARLIEKIDLRRPQVYLEAMIVTVTHDDSFRWAVDTQGIFGQFGIQSVFGLTSPAGATGDETGNFLAPRVVNPSFNGLTAALIRSDSVPFVLNVLASDADTRILASPQVLVDDNEEATILSQEGQPTTSISQGTTTDVTSFQGFEEAGPELSITPHISEGGYVRLEFSATLSSFIGESTQPGIPPPRLENSIETSSVRVPTDSTIIVGGLSFETISDTVVKVPLLGDIPLIGLAFKDIRKSRSNTTLYVFITPRIMRDDHFLGEILNSVEPARLAGIDPAGPPPPEVVKMRLRQRDTLEDEVEETLMRYGDTGQE